MKTGEGEAGGGAAPTMESLPESIINEVLLKTDLESLCSMACVSRSFHLAVSQILPSLSSLDLSEFSPDAKTLKHILCRVKGVKRVTIDCLRLNDFSIVEILGEKIQELNLLKCCCLSYSILASIGRRCPNLRVLVIELGGLEAPDNFEHNLVEMLKRVSCLESLSIKIRGREIDVFDLESMDLSLPKSVILLKLQPVNKRGTLHFLHGLRDNDVSRNSPDPTIPVSKHSILCLSLVIDVVSDELIISIVNSLPQLIELDLEDRPYKEPLMPNDLTNNGLQSLSGCRHLTTLSIVRSRLNFETSFKRVTDMGVFLLSESCKRLESVRLGGFSKVTDAGFATILHSCQNLKKLEIRNAALLSDLTFHDVMDVSSSLVDLRLISCNLITSDAMEEFTSSSVLQVLDLSGCRSIADTCLGYISLIKAITTLKLEGADITDSGLAVLNGGDLPIVRLSLRGCRRITDKGIARLLHPAGTISMTLSSLDLGHMPGISDEAILTIASAAPAITELCIRYCFFVTAASLKSLASVRRIQNGCQVLRKLDFYHCLRLCTDSLGYLLKPSFRGLRWLGAGCTPLASKRDNFTVICKQRPWLTVCFEGCEIGCHDGWQFHMSDVVPC